MKEELDKSVSTPLFKNKNFVLIFLGGVVSLFGTVIYNFAMGWYILVLTDSPTQFGIYLAIGMITLLVLQPIGGVIADRINKVKIVYLTDFMSGIILLLVGYLISMTSDENAIILILYISAFIINICAALFRPAKTALFPLVVADDQYQSASSFDSMVSNLINIIGMFVGALFYAIFGPVLTIIINGISYIISGISETFVRVVEEKDEDNEAVEEVHILKDMKTGYLIMKKDKPVFNLIIGAIGINFFLMPVFSIYLPYFFNKLVTIEGDNWFRFLMIIFQDADNLSLALLAFVEVIFSIGAIIGAIYLSIKEQKEKIYKMIALGLVVQLGMLVIYFGLVSGYLYNFIGFNIFYILFLLIILIIGIYNNYINVPLGVAVMKRIDKEYLGRVMSILMTLVGVANPISILIFSYFLEQTNITISMLLTVIGSIIVTTLMLTNREVKKI